MPRKASTTPTRKRGRPPAAPLYPPPPPPPPPPVNNPYYQKFFSDYWKKYSQGYDPVGTSSPAGRPPRPKPNLPFAPPPPAIPPMMGPPPPTPTLPPQRIDMTAGVSKLSQEEYPCNKTDRTTYVLATPSDALYLSEKQCYVRTRMAEIFISKEEDVTTPIRGRRAAFAGQVGLRCVFCVPVLGSKDRVERAICYPTKISKFYQTVQDMQHFHFATCPAIPIAVKERFLHLRANMNNRRGEGKLPPREYWAMSCKEVGMVEQFGEDGNNLGVTLKEDHLLVERSKLPVYAKELFMPPQDVEEDGEKEEEKEEANNDEEGEKEQEDNNEGEEEEEGGDNGNEGGIDDVPLDEELVADLEEKEGGEAVEELEEVEMEVEEEAEGEEEEEEENDGEENESD